MPSSVNRCAMARELIPTMGTSVGRSASSLKRIALRCEKTARNYTSFVALALDFILIKSVHTA